MQIQTANVIYKALLCLCVFGMLVLLSELLRHRKYIEGELARKFVHTTTGTWAALWPLFLDMKSISVLSLLLTIFAIAVRFLSPLKSIYSIKRLSLGEILIGVGLAFTAWFSKSGSVFTAAVLIISWSDSVAAIIGTRYGRGNSFKVYKSKKSVIGSLAFFATTAGIVFGFMLYEHNLLTTFATMNLPTAVFLSLVMSALLTFTEILGIYGSDNLTVPILAMLLLNLV